MGECYWHGGSYPCSECEKDQSRTMIDNRHHDSAKEMIPEHRYCSECGSYYIKNKKHRCI